MKDNIMQLNAMSRKIAITLFILGFCCVSSSYGQTQQYLQYPQIYPPIQQTYPQIQPQLQFQSQDGFGQMRYIITPQFRDQSGVVKSPDAIIYHYHEFQPQNPQNQQNPQNGWCFNPRTGCWQRDIPMGLYNQGPNSSYCIPQSQYYYQAPAYFVR
jgi:hypothetical protein